MSQFYKCLRFTTFYNDLAQVESKLVTVFSLVFCFISLVLLLEFSPQVEVLLFYSSID